MNAEERAITALHMLRRADDHGEDCGKDDCAICDARAVLQGSFLPWDILAEAKAAGVTLEWKGPYLEVVA